MQYIFNDRVDVIFEWLTQSLHIPNSTFKKALELTNQKIEEVKTAVPTLFWILWMRNLSAFVWEVFVESMSLVNNELFIKNPHQDWYPDILVMTEEWSVHWKSLSANLRDKWPFSNFETWWIEVKATCWWVPTAKQLMKKWLNKPGIWEQRIDLIKSYDRKAHHRETNNLIWLVRDFIWTSPTIVWLYYSWNLEEWDRWKIVKPKEWWGRTTSVSIMTRAWVHKMYTWWVAVYNDTRYIDFFDSYNKDNLMKNYINS